MFTGVHVCYLCSGVSAFIYVLASYNATCILLLPAFCTQDQDKMMEVLEERLIFFQARSLS